MKKTKIIATLGPASANKETIVSMAKKGMNVIRLNMSHGNSEDHRNFLQLVHKVREEMDIPVGILMDTRGPEVRLQKFADGKAEVVDGQEFVVCHDTIYGNGNRASVTFKDFYKCVKEGDEVLLCDGNVKMIVKEVVDKDIVMQVVHGGTLSNSKSINIPGIDLKMEYLNDADKKDILIGIEEGIEFIAASFVSCAQDVLDIQQFLADNNGHDIDVIAKIESVNGIKNLDSILDVCNGIMIARGDLGVEIAYEKLPQFQKELVKKARTKGKRVIVATEMLESMVHNARPTRAEASDVANAVYDGASAIMLSAETAAGVNPTEAVATMAKIAMATENCIHYNKRFLAQDFKVKNIADSISNSAVMASLNLDCKAILVVTEKGMSARMVSRFRPKCPIIGITPFEKTYYKLALSWGVIPVLGQAQQTAEGLFDHATQLSLDNNLIKEGDRVVTVASSYVGRVGETNLLKIEDVKRK